MEVVSYMITIILTTLAIFIINKFLKKSKESNKINSIREDKKKNALDTIDGIEKEIFTYVKEYNKDIYNSCILKLKAEKTFVENAAKIVAVVAELSNISSIKNDAVTELLSAKAPVDTTSSAVENKDPVEKTREDLFETTILKTKGEVDQYVEKIKTKLYKFITDGGIKIK